MHLQHNANGVWGRGGGAAGRTIYLQSNVLQQRVLQHSLQLPVDLQRQVQGQPAVRRVGGVERSHDASPPAHMGFIDVRRLGREGPGLLPQHVALDDSVGRKGERGVQLCAADCRAGKRRKVGFMGGSMESNKTVPSCKSSRRL